MKRFLTILGVMVATAAVIMIALVVPGLRDDEKPLPKLLDHFYYGSATATPEPRPRYPIQFTIVDGPIELPEAVNQSQPLSEKYYGPGLYVIYPKTEQQGQALMEELANNSRIRALRCGDPGQCISGRCTPIVPIRPEYCSYPASAPAPGTAYPVATMAPVPSQAYPSGVNEGGAEQVYP